MAAAGSWIAWNTRATNCPIGPSSSSSPWRSLGSPPSALAPLQFSETDPRTIVRDAAGQVTSSAPIRVKNMLSGVSVAGFVSKMVKTFTDFPPLGVVLVAMLGIGVAEATGFLTTALKYLLRITPALFPAHRRLLPAPL